MGWWNAHVKVEGTVLGLGWAVTDDKTGAPTNYATLITLTVPEDVGASVSKKAPNETVLLRHDPSLPRGSDRIEANAAFQVSALQEASGKQVEVKVATVAGQKANATGDILAQARGDIGQTITIHFGIPTSRS